MTNHVMTNHAMTNPLASDLDHVLAHTPAVWEELADARIFVTGGTGFFGCWLLESFAWACDRLRLGASITVLTRSPEAIHAKAPHLTAHPAIQFVQGDVRTFEFPAGRFTHVIHGATEASASLNRDRPLAMLDTIVEGTRRTLDFAVSSGAKRFLLTSSGAVYGTQPPELPLLPETYTGGPDCADPRWVYGEGKRLAELLCAVYARQFGVICPIARGFAFTGPYMPLDIHFAIGNFISSCAAGRSIEIHGDGTPYRSYLYAADLAIWLWTILVHGASCRPYNIGSQEAVSIADLAATVAATLNPGTQIRVAQAARTGALAQRYVPDTSRARNELGLAQHISLEDAIGRTAAWHCIARQPSMQVATL
jgi:nucleoside-diphosphate-sugar epimerase